MKPLVKLHIWSAGYCLVLAGLNWSRTVVYSRDSGILRETLDGVGGALLLSGAVAFYLLWRCIRSARARLEAGRKVEGGRWVQSRSVLVYALPLLFHSNSTSSWTAPDGALVTVSGGYGSDRSFGVFLCGVVGLLLFQILRRLSTVKTAVQPLPGTLAKAPSPSFEAVGRRS